MNYRMASCKSYAKGITGFTLLSLLMWATVACGVSPNTRTHIKNVTFVAFDTETTGLSPYTERIIEIGAIKFRNGEVIETREWLIKPDRPIHWRAEQVHNISMDMLKDSPSFSEMYSEFAEFIEGTVLLAHNAPFDLGFLREEILRNQLPMPDTPVVDSLRLFRNWFPDAPSHSMERLTDYLGVSGDTYHRALADAVYIMVIMNKGLEDGKANITLKTLYDNAAGYLQFEPTAFASPQTKR